MVLVYEFMIDHCSHTHNLSSCEIKPEKKIQAWTGLKPMTSAIPMTCLSNWAIKPTGSWSLFEFVEKKVVAKFLEWDL